MGKTGCSKRWDITQMMNDGLLRFNRLYNRISHFHYNHRGHFLARDIDSWLREKVVMLCDGRYDPAHLTRSFYKGNQKEVLLIEDAIAQHVLLQQIKKTFSFIIHPHCYHIHGPNAVTTVTNNTKAALETNQYQYFLRLDIKSYYQSINHHLLIKDIKSLFDDTKLQSMLINIIKNPIDTEKGTINPDSGLPIRGPLSHFLSALYLKPLDVAFSNSGVHYARYNDDILILCKSKRQHIRAKRIINNILYQRKLTLSKKKSKLGHISQGFHFLGFSYSPAQTVDKSPDNIKQNRNAVTAWFHPRTFRNAYLKLIAMVTNGLSTQSIRTYLLQWARFWNRTNVINEPHAAIKALANWTIDKAIKKCIFTSINTY